MVKRLFFLIAMSVGMIFPTMAQNIPSYVPTNGLVGWWPFNGNANDESGNWNHGTVNGASLTTDRDGKSNSAYSFDGLNDDIVVKNNQIFNFEDKLTISAWFANDTATILSWPLHLIMKGNKNFTIKTGIPNRFSFGHQDVEDIVLTEPNTYQVGKWIHYVISYDFPNAKIYLNGKLAASGISTYKFTPNQSDLTFGSYLSSIFSKTRIDDITFFNRALTQQEITALYTSTPTCTNPTATITPQGKTTFCQGGFVNLNASTGANYTYQWYNNGQIINGATASTYQAKTAGNYTVKVMDGTCSTASSATLVTVNPNPTASITPQGNTTFCQGGFVNLVASGGTSYQWNTGASSSSITANQSGTYVVNVFNSFGCQASASQVVVVNSNPIVAFNGLNDYTLKTQQTIQLIASPSGGNFVGDGINGATFNPVNVTLGKKTITYNYTSLQGCKGSATRSTIIVDSVGNVCNVTKYDTVTFTKNITKYDTITITKNVTKYDTITIKNNIYDTVTITNNVTKYDTILKLKFKLTTGINANQMTSMTLYPNPTTDVLYIEIDDAKALDGYRYRILDAVGKEVYNQLVKNPKTEIPLKSLGAAGMYLFEVIDQQNKTIQSNKIVLE